ncbi:MAG TPA: thioredoxin family protein [Candidatus Binatia bacterium]|nr:thioredoxin family protein [Candidatus Binatia bacterium]
MKRTLLALAILAALPVGGPVRALNIGDPLAEKAVRMKAADGRDVSIGDVAGQKGTLVLFTCNACPWVKAWETRIAELGNEYRKQGIGVIAVNSNDPSVVKEDGFEVMEQRAKERGFEFPYAVDEGSKLARAYGASRTPEAFLFDAEGKLVYHGTIDDNAQQPNDVKQRYLRDALQAVVDGKPVPEKETKSLGCTIKFYPES